MATKKDGHGSTLGWDSAGTTTFVTIPLVENITPPGRKRARIEGTALADTLETYTPGIEEYSEMTFTCFWEPGDSGFEALETAYGTPATIPNWQITFSDDTTWTFLGFISDFVPQQVASKQLIRVDVTVQRTGSITAGTAA